MKILPLSIAIVTCLFAACEKAEPTLKDVQSQLEFDKRYNESVEFVAQPSEITKDTVYLHVIVKGNAPTQRSYISLTQFDTTDTDLPKAIAGVHYVPFDDPQLQDKMVLEPGQLEADIPVILLRDASLKDGIHQLDFRIKSNAYFIRGVDATTKARIRISDQLVQPASWVHFPPRLRFFLGPYGSVKHRFIIDVSGEPWDDNFIRYYINNDLGAQTYYKEKFVAALNALNTERAAAGLPPLREDPDDATTNVVFP